MLERILQLCVVVWLEVSLVACGGTGAATTPPGGATTVPQGGIRLHVVTTMSILTDLITHVGRDRVQATNVIPLGAGPEDYQPTPQDAQTIARADVVFFNGHGLENWLDKLFTSAGSRAPRVELSGALQAIDVGGQAFQQGNPHFWMNPQHAIHYVEVIRDSLSKLDPAGAASYGANATAYIAQLNALDHELQTMADQIVPSERKMVTNHAAFPYFAQHYNFTIVGNILGNPEAELAAGDLADLVRKVKQQNVKAIFSESQFSPRVSQALAADAGVHVIANLYTDTLSQGGAAPSYIEMMRYDMRTIVAALKGQPAP